METKNDGRAMIYRAERGTGERTVPPMIGLTAKGGYVARPILSARDHRRRRMLGE